MGKKPRNSTDQEELKPRRKRQKRELNRIHSRILQAKQKLDNDGKGNKAEQKKQGRPKICKRLLPEPAAGIYRNGAKSKDIQKAETMENTYYKARLKADALKLFKGDTHESKCIVEVQINDKTTEQSSNEDCMKNSLEWTPEQSPILGTRQNKNHEPYLVRKKCEENLFEVTDDKGEKQNVNDESKHIQKENICKRRLFQNNKEQLEIVTTPTQTFNNTDLTKKNKFNEKDAKQTCSKSSKDSSCDPLSRYMEFCRIWAKNFEVDILPIQSDPVATTMKKLNNIYADSYHQQLLRKKKRELENVQSAYSVEHQACTSSDISQLAPVEFEVPKCSELHIAARLQDVPQKDNKLTQKDEFKKNNGIRRYSSTSCSSRNTRAAYNANCSIVENCENSETQCQIQSKDNHQLPKSKYICSMNKKNFMQSDSQKNTNYVNNLLKSKRHDEDNFSLDIPRFKQPINNSENLFSSDPVKYFKAYSREKLSIAVSDDGTLNNVSQKCNNKTTNKWNIKNIKRAPTILRRYNNVIVNKSGSYVQINDDYAKGLHEKCETNLFNRNLNNGIEKELYENAFPTDVFTNLPTSSTMNTTLEQTKILEPQIESMKIKDSQDSQVEQYHIKMRPQEHRRNGFCRYDDSLYPRTVEASYDTSAEKLPQQEQISLDMRKHIFHSNNYRPSNNLQGVNFSNSNVEPTKQFLHQTKLHASEMKKQEVFRKNTRDRNQNILLDNDNDRAVPIPIYTEVNFSQDIQTEKRFTESFREKPHLYDKTDVECAKNQINQNACHCNEQYIYYDPANCPRKYKEQAHCFHKEIAQPESLCDTRANYNNNTDNCVNLPSTTRKVPLLLKQKSNLHTYSKAIDEQHRAVLVQNVTQPVKYLAVENDSDIQRIPVYINDDKSVKIVENVPLNVITLMNPNTQTNAFPQEFATQVVPLQTDGLHLNDFTTRKISDQSFVMKRLNSMILLNPDSQSNIWYASNL